MSYSVALLGDTHYDGESAEVYHAGIDMDAPGAEYLRREFARNGDMWRPGGRSRALVAASGALAAADPSTRFVLQLGDLVQGDCADAATHRRMLEDAVREIRAAYPGDMPFLTVPGNHDVRGCGAQEGARGAYLAWACPFVSGQIRREVAFPVVSFQTGGDLWILCDFEDADPGAIAAEIDSRPDARYVFLATHGPFTAPDCKVWRWRFGTRFRDSPDKLRRLHETLLRRHAVVLSGHIHTTTFYRHEDGAGSFSEMTVNSVWSNPAQASGRPMADNPDKYGTMARGAIPEDRREAYDRDFARFRRSLKEYFLSQAAGHYRLEISDEGVFCDFYPGDAMEPCRRFPLLQRGRLAAGT